MFREWLEQSTARSDSTQEFAAIRKIGFLLRLMPLTELTCRLAGKPKVGRVFAIRTDERASLQNFNGLKFVALSK
jgi:hypothetical protein